jgi:AcrR family transcriptional regulator
MIEQDDKERILSKASERFMETGFSKVTIDELASELGISKKTVYKFFPSKDVLLQAIVKALLSHVEREVSSIINADEPFERKITRLLTLIGRQMRRFGRQFQLDIQRYAPALWTEIETFRRDRIFSQVKKMFEQAKQENIFRNDLDINLFYLIFISSVQGIMNPKTLSENSFSAEGAFRGIIRILFEGALTNDARKKIHYFDVNYEQQ